MSQRKNASRCGTSGGYQRHRRNGEEACEPCKKALADYRHTYRVTHPADSAQSNRRVTARQRAALRVAKDFPDVFETYLQEELSA